MKTLLTWLCLCVAVEAQTTFIKGNSTQFINGNQTRFVVPSVGGGASTLLNGLQVYYQMANLTDSASHTNITTNNGGVTFGASGLANLTQCATFVSASSQWFKLNDNAYLQMGTGDYSYCCWFKSSSADASQWFCNYGAPFNNGYGFEMLSGAVNAKTADGVGFVNIPSLSGALNDGNWHFYLMVCSRAGNATFYVDNVSQGTGAMSGMTGSVNASLGGICAVWNGSIANTDGSATGLGLWNRALTTTEGTHLYNSGGGAAYPFTGL